MHGFQYRLVMTGTSSGHTLNTNSSILNIADVYGECSTGDIPLSAVTNSTVKTGLTTLAGAAFTSNAAHLSDGDTKTGIVVENTTTYPISAGSLSFNGYQDISVPSSSQLDFSGSSTNFTLESWVKINSGASSINSIVGKKITNLNTAGYTFFINTWGTSDRKLVLEYYGGSVSSTSTVPSDTWTHVAISVSNGNATFYINGTAAGGGGAINPTANSNVAMRIGSFGDYGNFYFNGGLADVRVWNVARTQTQILNNKNVDVSGQSNLLLNYKLNYTTGTTATNTGTLSSAQNGTLNGSPTWTLDGPATGTGKVAEIVADLGSMVTIKGIRLANFSGLKNGATTVYPNFTGGYLESSPDGSSWTKRINSIPTLPVNGATLALNDVNARYFRVRKEDQTTNAYYGLSELSLLGGGYETVPYIKRALPTLKYVLTGTELNLTAVANAISGATITSYQWSSSTSPVDGTFTNLTNGGTISGVTTTNLVISNYTNGTPTYYRLTATQSNGCVVSTQVLVNLETTPYYPITSGTSTLHNLSSWTVNLNGTVGSAPTAFADGKFFYLRNSSGGTYQLNSNWTNAGTLKLNGNSLSLTSTFNATLSSIEDYNSGAFIKTLGTGYLKSVVSNVAKVFPVGNSTYSPVTVTNNLGADEEFSVAVSSTVSNPESTNYINKTWQISKNESTTSGGTHLDVTFEWDSNDQIGTISEPMIYYASTSNPTSWTPIPAANYASIERSSNKISFKGLKGIISNTVTYFIARNTAAIISSISPNATGANNQVIISGNGFTGATSVTLGSTAVSSFTVNSSTQITAIVGSGTTGNVAVNTPGGAATLSNGFTFISPPTITNFTPTKTNNGATITINGTNFTGATNVSVGGVSVASYTVVNATQITAVLHRNTISGSVSVTTLGGTAISPGFVYGVPAGTAPTFVAMATINGNLSEIVRLISPPISSSTGAFTYSLPTNTVATVSGNLLRFNGVGTTTLTVNQAATADYVSGSTTAVVNVYSTPSILFPNINKVIGDANSTIAATSNSVGAFTYASSNTSVATISGTTLSIVGEGVTELSATQAANGFYTAAVEKAIVVVKNTNKQTPTISWGTPIYKNTDSSNFALERPTSDSSGAFTYYSSNSNVATIVGNNVTIVGEGTAIITAVQAATTQFNVAQIATQLIVQSSTKTNPTLSNFASQTKLVTDGTFTITAPTSNSTAPFTYIISNPDVAKISGSTITIVGLGVAKIIATQKASGIYNSGVIEATITVNLPALPVISYTDPANFRKNTAITSVSGTSTGGPISSYSISPNLPLGTSFNTTTGVITGTPSMISERKPYTITAKNIAGEGTATVQLAVVDIAPSGLSYTSPNTYSVGSSISPLNPTNTGSPITTYTVNPSLPAGLILNAITGIISGTPSTAVPTTTYTITGTNSGGSTTAIVVITVTDAVPTDLDYSSPNVLFKGVVLTPITPSNSGGAITSYSISPALPAGISINSTTGAITGRPTAASSQTNYTITGSNSGGTVTKIISILVNDNAPTDLSYTTPNIFGVNVVITPLTPMVYGGVVTNYTIEPELPVGLNFDTTTGIISGTPTQITANATYTVTAINFMGRTSATIDITIGGPATNLSYGGNMSLARNAIMNPITPTLNSTTSATYSASPSLPAGLLLNAMTGEISGTPTTVQSAQSYTVTANNGFTPYSTYTFTIEVVDRPTISYIIPSNFTAGVSITNLTPTVTGLTPMTFTSNPTLPAGLNLNASTGEISGTPAAYSPTAFYTITATNAVGSSSVVLPITVNKLIPSLGVFNTISKMYGDQNFDITNPTTNSTGRFSYVSSDPSVATIIGNTVTIVGVGTATITATLAADSDYDTASTTATLIVNKGNPTFGVFDAITKSFGNADFNLTSPTSNSSGAISYTSSDANVATINGNVVSIVAPGITTITALQAGDVNFEPGSTTTILTVSKAQPILTTMTPIVKVFGDANFGITLPTSSSTGNVSLSSDNPNVATVNGNIVTIVGAGTATIIATQATNANYLATTTSTTLTVNKLTPVLSNFNAIAKTTDDTPFVLIAPTSSGGTGTISYSSSNSAVATISGNVVSITGSGTTLITANQAADSNYNAQTITAQLIVGIGTTQTPTLTFPATNTTGATTLSVNYTLPETPLAGSVSLTFTPVGGGSPIIWTMDNATSANFNYVVGTNPTSIPNVTAGSSLGFLTYDVKISYQDVFGSPAAFAINTNIQTLAPPNINFAATNYSGVINQRINPISAVNTGGQTSSYSISPNLPSGLIFDTTTGEISGIPLVAMFNTSYSITATNLAGISAERISIFIDIDTDGDGIGNTSDPDIDNDGIPNMSDSDPDGDGIVTNGLDTDNDGINDANDPDVDGDGILNNSDSDINGDGTIDNGLDSDNDGINDTNDPDVDGDGIPNTSDSDVNGDGVIDNGPDTDNDGINDANDTDVDDDGIPNTNDSDINGDGVIDNGTDTDNDGINDANDPDIDGDGIPNTNDSDINGDGTLDNGNDTDNDGINDANDPDVDGDGIPNTSDSDANGDGTIDNGPDTDNDGINDANDPDIDGDGIPNTRDSDANGDGTIDNGPDTDSDGINDANDPDIDGDGISNTIDSDINGDGVIDNGIDTDNDGINDANDPDIDGDGISNISDSDVNGDGTIDNGTDIDNDGINDTNDPDVDGDGIPNTSDSDLNGDGTIDNGPDTDNDGINDTNDTDVDGDGIPNTSDSDVNGDGTIDNGPDTDNDGINDANDPDTDGDGVSNTQEAIDGTDPLKSDTDGDGVIDSTEKTDATDALDACKFVLAHQTLTPSAGWNTADCDGDGVPNAQEVIDGTNPLNRRDYKDSDGDGIPDYIEVQQGTNPNQSGDAVDTDNDGVPDYIEVQQGTNPNNGSSYLDSDGDGLSNYKEGYNYRNPSNSLDTDRDGTPDYLDLDSDGDSVLDRNDAFPTNPREWKDSDRDGTGDNADTDDDNDGILDGCDVDVNGDGIPDNGTDLDADGINDGCDQDKDDDGVNNTSDNCPNSPNANQADRDRDGQGDVCDIIELNSMQALTPNGDGINDTWVIYNLENHPGSIVRVFNSNGIQVFFSANYQNNWMGNQQGSSEMLPVGSYMFQIDLGGDGSIDEQGWLYITK
jgi:gliding motility-associated-like protein